MKKATALVVTACVVAGAALGTTGILVLGPHGSDADATSTSVKVKTKTGVVEKGDLTGTTTRIGKVTRPAGPTIDGGRAGIVTQVPPVGTVMKPRDTLYRVDDIPVILFKGLLPMWRNLEVGTTDGVDVEQLETNLHAWGYLEVAPDKHFDWRTRIAVSNWQRDNGLPRTGGLALGDIVFAPVDLVVGPTTAVVGSKSGGEIYKTFSTDRILTAHLDVGSPLARVGGVVEVHLPSGGTARGTVASVGAAESDEKTGSSSVPVVVRLDDPAQAAKLGDGDATIEFVSEVRKGVLSVPVLALGAASGGGFVVEVEGKGGASTAVPVTTGLFAGDRVEVQGKGLSAGQKVVVPA